MRPVLLVAWAMFAQASLGLDSLRCGDELVSLDDTEETVQARCGPPDATRDLVDPNAPPRPLKGQKAPYPPNIVWIYHGLPGQFDRILTFEDGILVDIQEEMNSEEL